VEYASVAHAHADYMRQAAADPLNKQGRILRELNVGDRVKIYSPPSSEKARRRKRRPKHINQWRGPMIITAKPLPTYFHLQSGVNPSKTFEHHIMNMHQWTSDSGSEPLREAATKEVAGVHDVPEPLAVGEMVFAREDTDTQRVDLAKVMSITDGVYTLYCWGTRGRAFKSAKFSPVFVRGDGAVLLSRPHGKVSVAPWIWEIDADSMQDLVPVRQVQLHANGKLVAAVLKRVKAIEPKLVLHRF
jgi:hypothetical protein